MQIILQGAYEIGTLLLEKDDWPKIREHLPIQGSNTRPHAHPADHHGSKLLLGRGFTIKRYSDSFLSFPQDLGPMMPFFSWLPRMSGLTMLARCAKVMVDYRFTHTSLVLPSGRP